MWVLPQDLQLDYFWQTLKLLLKFLTDFFSALTATDGKAPIATVEEEDDDVPGERKHVPLVFTSSCLSDSKWISLQMS